MKIAKRRWRGSSQAFLSIRSPSLWHECHSAERSPALSILCRKARPAARSGPAAPGGAERSAPAGRGTRLPRSAAAQRTHTRPATFINNSGYSIAAAPVMGCGGRASRAQPGALSLPARLPPHKVQRCCAPAYGRAARKRRGEEGE